MVQTDVLIVGGGPAGLAAAIAARAKGLRVTLVDSRTPPIDKACGEGLLPEAAAAAGSRPAGAVGVTVEGLPDCRPAFSVLWRRCFHAFALATCFCVLAAALRAQDVVVNFDPATTQVEFTLAATLHTVHGVFKLKSGQIHFDPATGKADGAVIVDATSGNTDNSSRDKKMHGEILESAKFPEIAFTPTQVMGSSADILAGKAAQLQVAGVFRLHGQDHAMTITVAVAPVLGGGQSGQLNVNASTKFDVPYVKWGLKNPSTFVLRVSDTVNLEIHSTAQISRPGSIR